MAIVYRLPERWMKYDKLAVTDALVEAKSAVRALLALPMQKAWAEELQQVQLKAEVAGTSRIEGAEFTDRELDEALRPGADESRLTKSQREARATERVYRWIAALSEDRPVDRTLVCEIHRRLVTEARDERTPPGIFRRAEQNVTFGDPLHRGATGGAELEKAFDSLMAAVRHEFRAHDPLIQALALHYHVGAMHPFQDWNGRTERALEAFMLQKARLKDALFIALANYYYDEKPAYLAALAAARAGNHDLTPFLIFGLNGIAAQCERLSANITLQIKKALFRDRANALFGKLENKRKRVIAARQLRLLELLLDETQIDLGKLQHAARDEYRLLKRPEVAFYRDLWSLENLEAVEIRHQETTTTSDGWMIWSDPTIEIDIDWPTKITTQEFFERYDQLPEAKTSQFTLKPGHKRRV